MQKLKMHSPDMTQEHIARIRELFPNCVTEARGKDGSLRLSVDFDLLRQELSGSIVEGPQERYHLDWPGKREAMLAANAPIAKALRPCREESVDFDATKNLFIEGDNLDALKLLQETYLGKVKMIYIDPPYNTGNDFIYEDDFAETSEAYLSRSNQKDEVGNRLVANPDSKGRFHSAWLSMMYPRLKICKNLLCDDGIVIISIDEREHSNIVTIANSIFGTDNFCGEIIWKNSSKNDQSYISIQHEYFVVYVKDKSINKGDWLERKSGLDAIYKAFSEFRKSHGDDWLAIHKEALDWYNQFPASNPIKDSKHYNWMDERGIYFPDNISGPNDGQYVYDVIHPVTNQAVKIPSRGWVCPKEKMQQLIDENRVHFGADHNSVPCLKTYLQNTEYQSLTSMRFVDGRAASKRLKNLFGEKVFTNPKDEFLLKDLFKIMGVQEENIVLDLFAGSATTAHAILELNRENNTQCRFILVQYQESLEEMYRNAKGNAKKITKNAISYLKSKNKPLNICEISKERIRLAAKELIKQYDGIQLDFGFRVLKVDTSNMADVFYTPDALQQNLLDLTTDNIKPGRTPEDLLFQVLLDWGVELTLPIRKESIQGKTVFFVDDNALVACFDRGIDEALVRELAACAPLRVVFRDNGFVSDAVKINVEQIFRQLSPGTEVRCL